mgnify:CR=1 FL=1|jgi:nicotinate-nucleotide--dimethylbenzimidazole phosphoribosyltransferase
MNLLEKSVMQVKGLDEDVMLKAKERVDSLIKPIGSLGRLEEIEIQLAGITGSLYPKVDKKSVIVMAADHGVYEEGIAAAEQAVTMIQTINIAEKKTGVGALANVSKADIVVVDIGVAADIENKNVINRKIAYGTKNIAKGPAMTRDEAIRAIEVGIETANAEVKKGKNILATGEMGIGNTTPSSAILSVVTGLDPSRVTGVGANLPKYKLARKIDVIKRSLEINKPDKNDPLDILSKLGGYEIAGMSGTIIGAAASSVPVVVDGFISTVSAIIACMIEPKVKGYLLPSHSSNEKAAVIASKIVNLKPILDLNMRLGEGSGAVLAFNIIEAATDMNSIMPTFEESGIAAV